MKPAKRKKRLEARVKAYEAMVSGAGGRTGRGGAPRTAVHKPGSYNK